MPSRMHPTHRTHTTARPPRRLIAGSGTITGPRPCEGRRLQGTPSRRVERYTYDAYGQPAVYNASWTAITEAAGKDNALRFCGYVYDAGVGLYHVRHRTYHATLGRWLQRDPAGYVDGMSVYEYCRSDSLNRLDANGTFSSSLISKLTRLSKTLMYRAFGIDFGSSLYRGSHPSAFSPAYATLGATAAWLKVRTGIGHDILDPNEWHLAVAEDFAIPALGTAAGMIMACNKATKAVGLQFIKRAAPLWRASVVMLAVEIELRFFEMVKEHQDREIATKMQGLRYSGLRMQGSVLASHMEYHSPGDPIKVCCDGQLTPITDIGRCSKLFRNSMASAILGQALKLEQEIEETRIWSGDNEWVNVDYQPNPKQIAEMIARSRLKKMIIRIQDLVDEYAVCVKKNCGDGVCGPEAMHGPLRCPCVDK